MKKIYNFQTANHIISGRNSISKLKNYLYLIESQIKSVLIIASPTIKRLGFVDQIIEQLNEDNIFSDVITDILPEPTESNINEVYQKISDQNYDVYIGIGGGSILDATKILSVLKTNDKSINELLGTDIVEKPGIPTILIPTTSGTGSEVTPNAIVTLPEEELKIGMVSRYLLPDIVFLDPLLTIDLPKSVTASTGMDAFTHALESFISNKANPISDMFALESIKLISSSIVEAFENGSSISAREKMLLGSMYGGMALTSSGTAAVHALAYPLGGKFNIPHGVANSMLLPHVMEFNMDYISNRLYHIAEPMKINTDKYSKEEIPEIVINKITEWINVLQIPQDLREFGVEESDLKSLSIAASKVTRLLNNNPKKLDLIDIENIYRKLL